MNFMLTPTKRRLFDLVSPYYMHCMLYVCPLFEQLVPFLRVYSVQKQMTVCTPPCEYVVYWTSPMENSIRQS